MKRPPRIAAVLRILGCCHDSLLATLIDISVFFLLKNFGIADIFCFSYLSCIDKRLQDFSSSRGKTSASLRRSPLYYNRYPWCKRRCLACVQPTPPLKKRKERKVSQILFERPGTVHRLNDTLSV